MIETQWLWTLFPVAILNNILKGALQMFWLDWIKLFNSLFNLAHDTAQIIILVTDATFEEVDLKLSPQIHLLGVGLGALYRDAALRGTREIYLKDLKNKTSR